MRVIEHDFTEAQMIHVDHLKDVIRGVKEPHRFHEQVEDIYAFFLVRGQNILSRQSIREGVLKEYVNSNSDYDVINSQIKHLQFAEFLIRVSNLKAFKYLVDEPEKVSESFVRAMFAVTKMQAAQQVTKKQHGGNLPLGQGADLNVNADEDGIEEFLNECSEHEGDDFAEEVKDYIADMSDFSMALPYLGDIFDMIDEDKDVTGVPGKGHSKLGDSSIWIDRVKHFINNFDLEKSTIYELAHNLDVVLDRSNSKTQEYYNTPQPEDVQNIDIEQGKDITKATPMEMVQDEGVFYSKMSRSELQQKVYQNPKGKAQCLYILCDCSGSMMGKRHNMAVAVLISLCRKSIKDGDKLFIRLFDESPHKRMDVTTAGLAKRTEYSLLTSSFSGGGTSITNALRKATDEIEQFKNDPNSDIGKCEILLITDGEDWGIDVDHYKDRFSKNEIDLHTVLVAEGTDAGHDSLKALSVTFNNASVDGKGALSIVKNVR